MLLTDFQLLEKLQQNEQAALKLLYDRYANELFIRARVVLKKTEDAEEVVQDVFIKLWNYRHTVSVHTSVKAYLYQMCRNLVFDYIKSRAQLLPFLPLESKTLDSKGHNTTEAQVLFEEYHARYANAVASLPPGRKKVYQLCQIEGKSYEQVAQQLSISRNAVKDHIVKATRFLKKYTLVTDQAVATIFILLCQFAEHTERTAAFLVSF